MGSRKPAPKASAKAAPLAAQQQAAKVAEAEEKIKGISIASLLVNTANLRSQLATKLDEIAVAVQEKYGQLTSLDTVILDRTATVKRLLGIENEAIELDEALHAARQELEDLKEQQEANIAAEAERAAAVVEAAKRKAETDAYEEKKRQTAIKDKFDQEVAAAKIQETVRKEAVERSIAIKTEELTRIEGNLDIQKRIDTAVAAAVAAVEATTAEKIRKETEALKAMVAEATRLKNEAASELSATKKMLESKQADYETLSKRLDNALDKVGEIAGGAVNSAGIERAQAKELVQTVAANVGSPTPPRR